MIAYYKLLTLHGSEQSWRQWSTLQGRMSKQGETVLGSAESERGKRYLGVQGGSKITLF